MRKQLAAFQPAFSDGVSVASWLRLRGLGHLGLEVGLQVLAADAVHAAELAGRQLARPHQPVHRLIVYAEVFGGVLDTEKWPHQGLLALSSRSVSWPGPCCPKIG